jgi:predicted acylesterase/phospholipase RssA
VFPAVPWEAQLLIDGGIVNSTPISHAAMFKRFCRS